MTFMYGHIYPHNKLNVETHDHLAEQLGSCNVKTLQHLQQLVIRGEAARFDYGREENKRRYHKATPPKYVDDASRLRLPIALISGGENRCFLPISTERTYEWLCRKNPDYRDRYSRDVVPHFGHWDNFVGAQASESCYPYYLRRLEQFN
jgi:hypothetical protein